VKNRKERIALVTGASRGLGKAIAESLARAGSKVVINYLRSSREAENAAAEITDRGGTVLCEQANILDLDQTSQMLDRIRKKWGPVEIIVHNATGPQPMKPFEEYSWQDFQDQLDFCVKAPVQLTQMILPFMKDAGWGRIINIGSEVVNLGNSNFSAYVAAKAAMLGLTRSWAREFGPSAITVNCIEPGWIPVERHDNVPEDLLRSYSASVPLGHQGVPSDVGQAVAFLASEEANFITGQCLAINGGNTF